MSKYVNIKDPSVIKKGMMIRSCLDWDHPQDSSDDGDGGTNDEDWFEARVEAIGHRRLDSDDSTSPYGYNIDVTKVDRRGRDHESWSIFLYDENLEYFEVQLTAWDE